MPKILISCFEGKRKNELKKKRKWKKEIEEKKKRNLLLAP